MIGDPELAAARSDAELLLPDLCSIDRKVAVPDGGGGHTVEWQPVAVDVRCRIAPLAGGERHTPGSSSSVGDRPVAATTHVVTLPAHQDLEETDRIRIAGQVYEVTLVRKRGQWELTRRAEVKEAP